MHADGLFSAMAPFLLLVLFVELFTSALLVESFIQPPSSIVVQSRYTLQSSSSAARAEVEDTQNTATTTSYLNDDQLEFCMAYINEHHKKDILLPFTRAFSELGVTSIQKNMWMGGSYTIVDATITDITYNELHIVANVQDGQKMVNESIAISLNAHPISGMVKTYPTLPVLDSSVLDHASSIPIDNFCRRMIRLCNIVKAYGATGKMIQMGVQLGGKGVGKLRNDLYLNQVPHNRYVRQYFYDMASEAALDATVLCSKKQFTNRMKMTVMFPEMNPSMDSYRIGTLLELARSIAIKLAEQNLRVRVCVQGSMGVGIFTGIPKQLTGVHTLMQRMDWQSSPGEENEGMVGEYINFGYIGKEQVVNYKSGSGDTAEIQQDDAFLLICPQNMIGLESSIMQSLAEMVDAAGDRPVIILNPDLTDKFSSQGQQSVRGRQQRLDFINSFETIFQFQNMYRSGTSYFPILGSLVKLGPMEPWVAHKRMDLAGDEEGEVYLPVYSSETQPESDILMVTMSNN